MLVRNRLKKTRLESLKAMRLSTLFVCLCVCILFAFACSGKSIDQNSIDEPEAEDFEARDEVVTVEQDQWYTLSGMFPRSQVPEYREALPENERLLSNLIARGGYLVESVADCGFCHKGKSGDDLSGGRTLLDETGLDPVPNITPDLETGIGSWSVAEVIEAFRSGLRPEDEPLSLHVHQGYRMMSNEDARAIVAYLVSQKPVKNKVVRQGRDYGIFPSRKSVAGYIPKTPDQKPGLEYGRYLVHSIAGCQRCHSPVGKGEDLEDMFSGSESVASSSILKTIVAALLDGREIGREPALPNELLSEKYRKLHEASLKSENKQKVADVVMPPGAPGIRGESALNDWTLEDLRTYLQSGQTPQGKQISSEDCPWDAYRGMSAKDLHAVSKYIKSL